MGNITGQFASVDRSTLIALQKAATSGNKIEAGEIDAIAAAAQEDGNLSAGESKLIDALREATRNGNEVKDFKLNGFDPTTSELSFDLGVSNNSGKVNPETADSYVNNLTKLTPGARSDLLKALGTSGISSNDQKQLAAILNRTGTPAQTEALIKALSSSKPTEIKAFAERFVALSAPEQGAVLECSRLLMEKPPAADMREQLSRQIDALPAPDSGPKGDKTGRALNALGLYLPNLKPNSPGSEDASSRTRASYLPYSPSLAANDPQRTYVPDMIKLGQQKGFKIVLQVPMNSDLPAIKAELMKATGIADAATFDGIVSIKDTLTAGYEWGEDNKWVNNDTNTLRVLASGPLVEGALDKAKRFTDSIRLKPGSLGYVTEGSHTAAATREGRNAWQGQVNSLSGQWDASQLGSVLNMTVVKNATYNEGGNTLSGTLPNGQPYGIVGRDGILVSTFLLEQRYKEEAATGTISPEAGRIAPDKVAARREQLGLDTKPLSPELKLQVDQTLARLRLIDPKANLNDAKNFIAKTDLVQDLFADELGLARENLTVVPQPDFHIDMHMRPLGPGQVMINDYNANVSFLEAARKRTTPGSWEQKEIDTMLADARAKQKTMQPVMDEIAKKLQEAGLDVVRAPGVMEGKMANGTVRHVNFLNAIPGSENGSNQQFYATNFTSIQALREEFEVYIKDLGIEQVIWMGDDQKGGKDSKSASERSLDEQGGLDCRENHALIDKADDQVNCIG